MTTIKNQFIGITHPITTMEGMFEKENDLILNAWKNSNCINGVHLFDEVLSESDHYLHCDACGMEVHISKIVVPDGKDGEI